MRYYSTKTYGHELGLSACFRQWRADSHCNQLHGYALSFELIFSAEELDERNWVIDFGSLKPIKDYLVATFDHRMLVATDDPDLGVFVGLAERGVAQLTMVERVGCEAFAQLVGEKVLEWLRMTGATPRVNLFSVECREHGANSAVWVNS